MDDLVLLLLLPLTIDDQLAGSLIGVADTLEVASVGDLGILDHDLALATILHHSNALVCYQRLIVFEPVGKSVDDKKGA